MAHLCCIGIFNTIFIKNVFLMILDSPQKIILVDTNNKGAAQIAHVRGLISAFVIHHARTCKMLAKLHCCEKSPLVLFVIYLAMISIVFSFALILLRKMQLANLH